MQLRRAQKERACVPARSDKRCALYIHAPHLLLHTCYVRYIHAAWTHTQEEAKPGSRKGSRAPLLAVAGPSHVWLTTWVWVGGLGGGWSSPRLTTIPASRSSSKGRGATHGGGGRGRGTPLEINERQGCAAWKGSRKRFQGSLLVSGSAATPRRAAWWTRSYPFRDRARNDRSVCAGRQAGRQTDKAGPSIPSPFPKHAPP